jgi:hypothetical protein
VPNAVPLRAVIVTVPSAIAVTSPVGLTVATFALLVVQAKVTSGMTMPPVAVV